MKSTPRRIPGLDGLRALSIIGVIISHVQRSPGFPQREWISAILDHGNLGVTVFFVLSGYLITTLLLKEEAKNSRISLPGFYVRRSVRILTPAYAYLAVICLLTAVHVLHVRRSSVGWAAMFLGNYHVGSPETGHFWSLGVEEQFYLLWPLMLIVLPRRARLPFAAVLLALCPAWKWYNYQFRSAGINLGRFDLNCDGLLAGCCLALARTYPRLIRICRHRLLQHWSTVLLATIVIVIGCVRYSDNISWFAVTEMPIPLCIAIIVNFVIEGHRTQFDKFLNAEPVMWIGRLSFSLYLWQQLFCFHRPRETIVGHFPLNIVFTFAAAIASYYLIELPALRLRDRNRPTLHVSKAVGPSRAAVNQPVSAELF